MTTTLPPSDWICRFKHLIPAGSRVLDVACGFGRHTYMMAEHGCLVTALDRENLLSVPSPMVKFRQADLEQGPWPLGTERFDAVIVTNYLWRPLFPSLCECLAENGVLLYETFAEGQQAYGRPRRSEFLLQPGELLRAAAGLRIVAYEDGIGAGPSVIQRLCAMRTTAIPHLYSGS